MSTTQNDKDLARLMQIADEFKRIAKLMHDAGADLPPYITPDVTKVLDDWILELCSPAADLNAVISVKSPEEIQIAHDICVGVIMKEVPLDYAPLVLHNIQEFASVLCWVLNHKHANSFEENLKKIREDAKRKGYTIKLGK